MLALEKEPAFRKVLNTSEMPDFHCPKSSRTPCSNERRNPDSRFANHYFLSSIFVVVFAFTTELLAVSALAWIAAALFGVQ
jgi:hypothetical protein